MVLNARPFLTHPPPTDPPSTQLEADFEKEDFHHQGSPDIQILANRKFNARSWLYTILNKVVTTHKEFESEFGKKDHLNATMAIFYSLLEWYSKLHYTLYPTDSSPPDIFALQ